MLAGNSQYFLGRKNDLENLNLQNLHKAAQTIDRNFDRTFSKYLTDLQERAQYMSEDEKKKYVAERLGKINSTLEQKIPITK